MDPRDMDVLQFVGRVTFLAAGVFTFIALFRALYWGDTLHILGLGCAFLLGLCINPVMRELRTFNEWRRGARVKE